jgi:lipopolysaccharide/colanic/teichoic acid biosynthesis glycosyltransferase
VSVSISPTISVDDASRWSKKQAALPHHRHAVRLTAVLIAVVGDISLIAAAVITAGFMRFQSLAEAHANDLLVVLVPAYLLAAAALKCYRLNRLRHPVESVGTTLVALAIATGFAFAIAFALKVGATYSRLESGFTLVSAAAFLSIGHVLYAVCLERLSGAIDPCVLILGPAFSAIEKTAKVDRSVPTERPNPADPVLLERIYRRIRHADRIILAFDDVAEREAWAQFVRLIGIDAEIIEPDLRNITVLGVSHWQKTPTLVVARRALTFGERACKRVFDFAIGVPLLCLFGPLLLLLMLLIKRDSPGPAVFAQPRVGRNNYHYRCYKLRTTYDDVTDPHGNRSTARHDDRITKIGEFLRRTSLDELPQLWNVIRGDMSLVGPRPHALGSTAEGALYWTRHAMQPGITGLAQVRGLRGAAITRGDIERRMAADFEYISSWSIWLDLKILLLTIGVLRRDAF